MAARAGERRSSAFPSGHLYRSVHTVLTGTAQGRCNARPPPEPAKQIFFESPTYVQPSLRAASEAIQWRSRSRTPTGLLRLRLAMTAFRGAINENLLSGAGVSPAGGQDARPTSYFRLKDEG